MMLITAQTQIMIRITPETINSTDTDYSGDDYSTDTDYSGDDSDTDYNDYTDGEDYSENE